MSKQWTRNYDNIFSGLFGCHDLSGGGTTDPTFDVPMIRHTNGLYYRLYTNSALKTAYHAFGIVIPPPSGYYSANGKDISSTSAINTPPTTIAIGTGTTQPTYDDYQLANMVSADYCTVGTVTSLNSYDAETHTYTKTYKIPIAYSGTEEVTITEFGLYIGTSAYSSSKGYNTLVYRETLDYPITISQNDTIEITLSQSIMQPNYTPYPDL